MSMKLNPMPEALNPNIMESTIVYWGYNGIGIMEKKMETTI